MIEIKNLTKTYNKGKPNQLKALDDVSLKINDGEFVAIIGKSGAGKSTLMHILGCIDNYDSGEYLMDGVNVAEYNDRKRAQIRNKNIGIVFTHPSERVNSFALLEKYTVIDNVLLPFDFSKKKVNRKIEKERAIDLLKEVGMEMIYDKEVSKLSGGQKQRVAIARAMIMEPKILLADEPTGALDEKTSSDIIALLRKMNEKGTTVIIITHDKDIAESCDRIIEIKDGRII